MSITNAISAIAVVGSIIVAGGEYPLKIRILGAIALFASMTNIVSGFLDHRSHAQDVQDRRKPAAGEQS
jgi:NAD/NADP transhydrogenase alpha subunit